MTTINKRVDLEHALAQAERNLEHTTGQYAYRQAFRVHHAPQPSPVQRALERAPVTDAEQVVRDARTALWSLCPDAVTDAYLEARRKGTECAAMLRHLTASQIETLDKQHDDWALARRKEFNVARDVERLQRIQENLAASRLALEKMKADALARGEDDMPRAAAAAAAPAPPPPHVLKPVQEVVVQRLIQCSREHGRTVNETGTGGGKGIMTPILAQRLALPILCIGLRDMERTIRADCKRQGVVLIDYIGWESLRGHAGQRSRGKRGESESDSEDDTPAAAAAAVAAPRQVELNHRWLRRYDDDEGNHRFEPTAELIRLVQSGVFIWIDEGQRSKNASIQTAAVSCFACAVFGDEPLRDGQTHRGVGGSCLGVSSASLFDRHHHARNLLCVMGFLPAPRLPLFTHTATVYKPSPAAANLMAVCKRFDAGAFDLCWNSVMAQRPPGCDITVQKTRRGLLMDPLVTSEALVPCDVSASERVDYFLYLLYCRLVRLAVAAAVSERFDADPEVQLDYKAVIYAVDEEERERLAQLEGALSRASKTTNATLGALNKATRDMEHAKVRVFIRVARQYLDANSQCKVIVTFNYLAEIELVKEALAAYGARDIQGCVSRNQRGANIKLFNEASATCRVLVCQLTTISSGCSLHDCTGAWPRVMLLSPSPYAVHMMQAYGRIKRVGVKGSVTVIEVYTSSTSVASARDELRVMTMLLQKSLVIASVAEQQHDDGVPFPGELPVYREQGVGGQLVRELPPAAAAAARPAVAVAVGRVRKFESGVESGTDKRARVESPTSASAAAAATGCNAATRKLRVAEWRRQFVRGAEVLVQCERALFPGIVQAFTDDDLVHVAHCGGVVCPEKRLRAARTVGRRPDQIELVGAMDTQTRAALDAVRLCFSLGTLKTGVRVCLWGPITKTDAARKDWKFCRAYTAGVITAVCAGVPNTYTITHANGGPGPIIPVEQLRDVSGVAVGQLTLPSALGAAAGAAAHQWTALEQSMHNRALAARAVSAKRGNASAYEQVMASYSAQQQQQQ